MSSQLVNDESKYAWIIKLTRELGLPIVILLVLVWWLGVRVEDRFTRIENDIKLHQKFLQQICVNTAPDWSRQRECWNIQ